MIALAIAVPGCGYRHAEIAAIRGAWQSLAFIGIAGCPGEYIEIRRCSCGEVLQRSLEQPWPIEPTEPALAARAIAARNREEDEHVCTCGHERRDHIDRVAGCVAGSCTCPTFRRKK